MKLRASVLQVSSLEKSIDGNLLHAKKILEKAISEGANFILFPELLSVCQFLEQGDDIMNYVEPFYGKTYQWLKENSKRNKVYLATTFLEKAEDNFLYNTFVIFSPQGKCMGKIRKTDIYKDEAKYIKSIPGNHILKCKKIGKIGVLIGYEFLNQQLIHSFIGKVDIVLIPAAVRMPETDDDFFNFEVFRQIEEVAQSISEVLKVPVLFSNKCEETNFMNFPDANDLNV